MDGLEAEYTIHSDRYDLCREAINLKHTNELSLVEFIDTLIALPDKLVPKGSKKKLQKIELYMSEITPHEKNLTIPPKHRSKSI